MRVVVLVDATGGKVGDVDVVLEGDVAKLENADDVRANGLHLVVLAPVDVGSSGDARGVEDVRALGALDVVLDAHAVLQARAAVAPVVTEFREEFAEFTADPARAAVDEEHRLLLLLPFLALGRPLPLLRCHHLLEALIHLALELGLSPRRVRHERAAEVTPVTASLTVIGVPIDGLLESLLPRHLLRPPESEELAAVDEVATVVEFAVGDVHDRLRDVLAERFADVLSDGQHGPLLVRADVVNPLDRALVQDGIKRGSRVVHVHVRTRRHSVAVDGNGAAALREHDELGDGLLRVLVRTVHVVTAGDDVREVVRPAVGHDKHLSARLGGRVRVGRLQEGRRLNVSLILLVGGLAVDLVGGDVEESLDGTQGLDGLEQNVGTADVVLGELERVAERVVDVGLRSKVHHGVDLLGPHDVGHEIGGSDITLDKLEVEKPRDRAEVIQVGAIVELVDDDDLSVGVGVGKKDGESGGEMRRSRCVMRVFGSIRG